MLYPNCGLEPMTAAATVTTSIKVTLGRGGSRSGCCAEAEEKGKLLSCSSGLGCFFLLQSVSPPWSYLSPARGAVVADYRPSPLPSSQANGSSKDDLIAC